jgi:anti-sigma regulatory factor (Ser/Thr protein kinase)
MPDRGDDTDRDVPWALDLRGVNVTAVARVRRWATSMLTALDDTHLADVLLVATELVTNAWDHGDGAVQVRMSHSARPCQVLIEVDDNSREHPVLVHGDNSRPRGRGMFIVTQLATTWGVRDQPSAGSKTVWAHVSCDGGDRIPCARATTAAARWDNTTDCES